MKRFYLGDWAVSTISDGYLDLNQNIFVNIEPALLRQRLIELNIPCIEDLVVRTQINAYVVDTGDEIILVDTGCGNFCGSTTGFLGANLINAGYDVNQISRVLITHLHPDHMGGLLTADELPAFPEATIYVSSIEAAYWRDPIEEAKASDVACPNFALARKILAEYELNGRLQFIEAGESNIPGVTSIDAFGHTPGHLAFLFQSKKEQLLIWGDLVHNAGIQFAYPDWYVTYDTDGPKAALTRKRLFSKAATEHLLVGGHFSDPGLGYIRQQGDSFAWIPLC